MTTTKTFKDTGFTVKEQIVGVIALLAIVAVIGWFLPLRSGSNLSGSTGTPNIEEYDPYVQQFGLNTNKAVAFGSTLSVTGAATFSSTLGITGAFTQTGAATFSSTAAFNGLPTFNAGRVDSYPNSTSTSATTYTLVEADILHYNTVLITLSGGAATFTLPATSTITNLVPNAGDMEEQCWIPATNTLTFAAGTGIDLETASSSPTDLTILAGNTGCLKYIRQADTDISVMLTEFTDGD